MVESWRGVPRGQKTSIGVHTFRGRGLSTLIWQRIRLPRGVMEVSTALEETNLRVENYLYKLWIRACNSLGIKGVDLYGGTRHSTMQFLRKQLSPEGVKRLSLHTTNKALDRYLEIDTQELREGYALTRVHAGKPKSENDSGNTKVTPIREVELSQIGS